MIGNQITGEILRGVHEAGDEGSSEIGPAEEVEEGGRTAELGLNLDGSLNHGNLAGGGLGGLCAETADGLEGLLLATVADEPPGGLGGEEDEDDEGSLLFR